MRGQGIMYEGFERGADFERARTQISTPFAYLDVALDTAGVDQYYDICGDFLYFDALYDGVVSIELNNQQTASKAPFKASQGFALSAIFTRIKLNWAAQTGKKVRIMYSTGDRVVPSNSAVTSISGTVLVADQGISFATAFQSNTALSSATPENLFSAAANLNGGTVWKCGATEYIVGAANPFGVFIMKATAPASIIDGNVLALTNNFNVKADYSVAALKMERAVKFASGRRLDYINNLAMTQGMRHCLYTLN